MSTISGGEAWSGEYVSGFNSHSPFKNKPSRVLSLEHPQSPAGIEAALKRGRCLCMR